MDYEFESIIPWNGEHDTGRDARQKLDRNFAKIKANFEELGDAKFVTTAFFARIFGIDGEDGAQVDINDTEAVITAVKVKFGLYSESFVSAKGLNNDSGSTPGGATTLAALTDVSITTTPKDGQVLAYDITIKKWKPVDMEATAGIDEAQLAQYLTTNNYAKKADITAALTDYALKTTRITAGTGLTGGGTLAQDVTLSLAAVGTAGTYTKVTVDSYGRVTGHSTLTQGDIPALAISKITNLQTTLDKKLDKATFEEMFEKVWVSGYGYAIRAKLAFYSDDWISAKGLNSDAGSTTGGVDKDEVLQIVENAGYIKSSALNGYATQSWVGGLGYMSQGTADGRYYYNHGEVSSSFNNAIKGGGYFTSQENWPSNGPGTSWQYGLMGVFNTRGSNMGVAQLWMSHDTTAAGGVYVRTAFEANGWSAWRRLMDNACIGNYTLTPSNYTTYTVTKTGGGASGTWGIGISGNAASATKLQTARTLWGQPFDGTGNVNGTLTVNGGIVLPYASGTWLSMATRGDLIRGSVAQSSGGAHSLFRVTAYNGNVLAFGGLGNDVGFYGYSKANIDNNTNNSSFRAIWNMANGNFIFSNNLTVGGYLLANAYVQVGGGRIYWDSTNNALYVQKSDGTQCGFYATGFMSAKGLNSDGGSAVAGATTLNGLSDVTISSPSNGQSLVYRNGVWKNEMVSGGGSASVNWDDINGKPTWIPDTDGSGSDIDADLLDGTHKSGLFSAMTYSGSTLSITIGGTRRTATIAAGGASSVSVSSTSSRNISVTVDGATDYVNDLYATYSTYADQLRTARTIWGQSFNGGSSISGNMTGVGTITFAKSTAIMFDEYGNPKMRTSASTSYWGVKNQNNVAVFAIKAINGYVGIGTTSPVHTLHVNGGIYGSSYIQTGSELIFIHNGQTGVRIKNSWLNGIIVSCPNMEILEIQSGNVNPAPSQAGNINLGTTTSRWKTVYSVNSLNTSSDLRLKDILSDIPLTVEQVAAAPSFLYRWKNGKDGRAYAGSAAQYWQKALPQAVAEGADGYLAMEYDRIALAAAIATARAVVDHEQRIRKLEQQLLNAV